MKRNTFTLLISIFILHSLASFGQEVRYFTQFTDKASNQFSLENPQEFLSEKSIQRREKQGIELQEFDLPPSNIYLDSLESLGAKVIYTSRWMNGALLQMDASLLPTIQALSFTKELPNSSRAMTRFEVEETEQHFSYASFFQHTQEETLDYGNSFDQISLLGIDEMHAQGYRGEGMTIAIIDAGFRNADRDVVFDSLFANNQILGTYDFVEQDESVYEDNAHGMRVFSVLAGNLPGQLIGTAFKADYYLFRSENDRMESRLEEIYWLFAAERADSLGVDVINSSLGYSIFDDDEDTYTEAQLDGNTALTSIAADFAAAVGMIVVVSGGNGGNDFVFNQITPPADADSVLAVGAVDASGNYANFSSPGPSADGRVKPDVMAVGSGAVVSRGSTGTSSTSGSSFASPAVAGLATGLWQAFPEMTNMEIIDLIRQTASQSESPDEFLGFGIPNFVAATEKANEILGLPKDERLESINLFPNPIQKGTALNINISTDLLGESLQFELVSLDGKKLLKTEFLPTTKAMNLELPTVAQGLYLLRIISEKGFSVKKLSVK